MKKYIVFIFLLLLLFIPSTVYSQSTYEGDGAGESETTGTDNVGFGIGALRRLTTGRANTAYGSYALRNITTGWGNIGIGMLAGQDLTTETHKLYINNGYYPTLGIFGDLSTGSFGINNIATSGVALTVTGMVVVDSSIVTLATITTANISGILTAAGIASGTTGASSYIAFKSSTDKTGYLQVISIDTDAVVLNVDTLNERVGILTATPTAELDVVGDIVAVGATLSGDLGAVGVTLSGDITLSTDSAVITASTAGTKGDMKWGTSANTTYLYVCYATNSWRALAMTDTWQ